MIYLSEKLEFCASVKGSSSSSLKPALTLSAPTSDSQPSMLSLRAVVGLVLPDSVLPVFGDSGVNSRSFSVSVTLNAIPVLCFLLTLSKLNLFASPLARGLIAGFFSVGLLPFQLICKSLDDCERPMGGGRLNDEGPKEPGRLPPRSTLSRCWSCV